MADARPFLDRLQRQAYSVSLANAHVLQGLYQGHYYSECLKFFRGLCGIDVKNECLNSSTAIFAVLKAAYQLQEYAEVLRIYDYILKKGITPNRSVVFLIAEVSPGTMSNE